jgi:hypothetical protein
MRRLIDLWIGVGEFRVYHVKPSTPLTTHV